MELKLQEQTIFSTSIQHSKLNLNIDNIINDSYKLRDNVTTAVISNENGYQSPSLNPEMVEKYKLKGMLEVKSFLDSLCVFYTNHFEKNITLSNFWVNINNKNSFNKIHTHPGAFLSGILYIKNSESAATCFVNNNLSEVQHFANYLNTDLEKFSKLRGTFKHYPEDNSMVVFTGAQQHYVDVNNSEEDRITIAFNLIIEAAYQ